MHARSEGVSSAAFVVALLSGVGAVLGIVRNALLASRFGVGAELDVYYASFRIPDFIYGIFYLGIVSVVFLPVFNDLLVRGKEEAWKFFGAVAGLVAVVLGVGAVVLFFTLPFFIKGIVPGFTADQLSLTVVMTRLMLLQPILLGVSNVVSGALQSFQRFIAASMGAVLYNLGIIVGIVFFVPSMGAYGLAWGVVLGAALHLAIQLPVLARVKDGVVFRIRPDLAIVRPYLHLVPPRILHVLSNQANAFAITIFASMTAVGSLAVLNLAYDIQALPQTIVALSLSIAVFPVLSKTALHNKEEFSRLLNNAVRTIVLLLAPASFFIMVFRAQIVRLVLGYGVFGWDDTRLTLNTLLIFSVGIVFQAMVSIFARAFFSLQDTKTPLAAALASNAVTIILGLLLFSRFGVLGIAAALVVAGVVQAALLVGPLIKQSFIDAKWIVQKGILITALSALAAISGRLWLEVFEFFGNDTVIGLALQTGFSMLGAGIVLAALFVLFRVDEFGRMIQLVRVKILRKK